MYGALDISTSGMIAQRQRMEVIAANVANENATLDSHGNVSPYRRRVALLAPVGNPAGPGGENGPLGVRVAEIALDQSPFRKVYDPTNPIAAKKTDPAKDEVKGYVNYPNVDTTIEMINAVEASRAYEANVMAAEASKTMMAQAMRLIA